MRVSPSKWFVMQGRSQDFFRDTRNSPNRFAPSLRPPPPEEKKQQQQPSLIIYRFGYVVSLRVFSAFEMTLATYKIICRVFGSIDWCRSIIYHTIRLRKFLEWIRCLVNSQCFVVETISPTYPDTFRYLVIRVCNKTKMALSLSWI